MYKKYIGIDCLGCGMQRSFIALLKGDIVASIQAYPALLPMVFMLLFLLVHIKMKFKYGALILKYTFIATATIMVLNYLFRIL